MLPDRKSCRNAYLIEKRLGLITLLSGLANNSYSLKFFARVHLHILSQALIM